MEFLEKKHIVISIIMGLSLIICVLAYLCFNFYNKECICEDIPLVINDEEIIEEKVYVDIKGAVVNPGVYESNTQEIINDIIIKAGGLTKDAYTDNINLSKKVEDELVIYVYTKNEVKKNSSTKQECSVESYIINTCTEGNISIISSNENISSENQDTSLININTADINELTKIPGIGEVKAKSIIAYRTESGLFKTIEDIKNVSGIGDATFEKIKDYITV